MLEKAINKILEIDVDTSRINSSVKVLNILHTRRERERQPSQNNNNSIDHDEQLDCLTLALVACVRYVEEKGIYKHGEAMAKVVNSLGNIYADTNVVICDFVVDNNGNKK